MSLSERDRKILMMLIPVALVAAYWFLVLAPKRKEATQVQQQLTQAQSQRDTAQQAASQLSGAKRNYGADYATVIYLGKSIPSDVDMPSLLVQLDRAARGTGISFADVKTGQRTGASASPAPASGSSNGQSGSGSQSGSSQSGSSQSGSSTSSTSNSSQPASAAAAPGAAGASNAPAGLDSVPLDFEFRGSFFHMADFFHRMKRFVRVANKQIIVRGRLLTINSFSFDATQSFPMIDAKVHATVYLAPKDQGVSAGASPQGPAGATAPAGQQASTGSSSTPAATVTP